MNFNAEQNRQGSQHGDAKDVSANELSDDDILKLIKSPLEKKVDITKKIAEYYKVGGLNESQMVSAAKIFRALVQHTELEIRKTLSDAIKDQPNIPRDVIMILANDVNEVSMPILQFSDVLTDEDLIEIVNSSSDAAKQIAIAKRSSVSVSVSDALVNTNNDQVVGSLLKNERANVSNDGYNRITEVFSQNEAVMNAMIERESLPIAVVENLANKISETIYNKLSEKHKDLFQSMKLVVKSSKDVATMKVIGLKVLDGEYYQFSKLMEKLQIARELVPIYALCIGNINIFEVNVARFAKTPVLNIRTLVQDPTNRGFKVLYEYAGLPKDFYNATELLITVLREMLENKELFASGLFITKETAAVIVQKLIKIVGDVKNVQNLDYLISLINTQSVSVNRGGN
jgi:uncharacterized protein (DUF2336 family)